MMLDSLTLLSNYPVLLRSVLTSERSSLSLCGRCAAYFLEYYFSTLHFSGECPGKCSKQNLSAPVILLLQINCISCLVLSSTTHIGVGRQGGFSSIYILDVTVIVGIYPRYFFRRCLSLINLFSTFHLLKHCAGFQYRPHLEFQSL